MEIGVHLLFIICVRALFLQSRIFLWRWHIRAPSRATLASSCPVGRASQRKALDLFLKEKGILKICVRMRMHIYVI